MATPKYQIIVNQIIQEIQSGEKQAGERLPSIRQMAALWQVSKNTVIEAYQRLEAAHYILAKQGAGYYVASRNYNHAFQNISPELAHAYNRIGLLGRQLSQDFPCKPGDGRYPRHLMATLPFADYLGLSNQSDARLRESLHYGNANGHPILIAALCELLEARGLAASPDNILLTAGSNHAFDLIIRHFLSPNDYVLVESPGYYPLIGKLEWTGMKVLSVARYEHGLDLANLKRLIARFNPKIFFLQPHAHNPTGTDLPPKTQQALYRLSQQHQLILVEDDPFLFTRQGTASLLAEPAKPQHPVIYLGSFSKILSASLRSGYLVAAAPLVESLSKLKLITSVNTSAFIEAIIADLIEKGYFVQHCQALRQALQTATAATETQLKRLPFAQIYQRNDGGFYFWCRLPETMNDLTLAAQAEAQQIFIAPGRPFFPTLAHYPAIRLNAFYSNNDTLYDFLKQALRC